MKTSVDVVVVSKTFVALRNVFCFQASVSSQQAGSELNPPPLGEMALGRNEMNLHAVLLVKSPTGCR